MVYPLATWEELKNAQPGQDLGTLPKNIARAGKDCLCDVYKNYPEWASAVADPIYGIMQIPSLEDLCKNHRRSVTDDVPVKPNGGQCPGVFYTSQVRFTGLDFGGDQGVPFDTGFYVSSGTAVKGPVTVFTRSIFQYGQASREIWARGSDNALVRIGSIGGKKTVATDDHKFFRVDGLPDTCGPGPVPPVRVPPIGDIMKPTPIPTINGPIIVPVVVPVGVFIHPQFQINIGSINLNFELGGVYITPQDDKRLPYPRPTEPQPSLPPGGGLPDTRPPASPPTSNPNPGSPVIDLSPITNDLQKIKSYTRRPKTKLEEVFIVGGQSNSLYFPARTKFIVVDVSVPPPNVRVQSGGGDGPDVYHQGWCAMGYKKKWGERIPLSYGINAIPVCDNCDSFSYTLYEGGFAAISAIVESDLSECKTYECG